jgi:chromosome segregation ATPase
MRDRIESKLRDCFETLQTMQS